ncbi:PREDICTED: peptidyl-prolyl cis-trans isomerase FKBP13, chloroplastic-like isoform X2 [Nelumbo nucifera]|uniref:peptidylprolyl isomerase n=1 Tax=Nelumbo nucifera TaxID=4432 RepID=A0A1U8A1C9_NELNU|nr:PREDICTED: peptidyl-prolyl cis-trans isomerase FKBP13, chloroplastic-like isoform X2 [Nelumbo nucifera]
MSASAFAPWSCCLKKLGTPRRRRDLDTTEPTTVTISTHRRHDRPPRPLQQKESSRLSRRLVIELGFCLGLVDAFIQQPREGFAAESQCELTLAPSGLAYCDRVVGTGPEATKGQLIKVIKGWDQGILGGDGIPPMFAGGKRTLKLPPELGYGMRGAGCKGGSCIIPPDSILLFDVEFIGKA